MPGFGMRLRRRYSTEHTKSSHVWRQSILATDIGGFIVEGVAALTILGYIGFLWFSGRWEQKFNWTGFSYSALTGVCVGTGTVAFFLLFQRGGPLTAVPAILAGGAAIMAIAGIMFFNEPASWQRMLGVVLAITGLFLLRG